MIQFDEHIFQMGWFNHQPDDLPHKAPDIFLLDESATSIAIDHIAIYTHPQCHGFPSFGFFAVLLDEFGGCFFSRTFFVR